MIAVWPATATAEDVEIPAGGMGDVPIGTRNVVHIGSEGCTSSPSTLLHISPTNAVTVLTNLVGFSFEPGNPLSVQINPGISPGVTIIISWSSNDGVCNSFNGVVSIKVGNPVTGGQVNQALSKTLELARDFPRDQKRLRKAKHKKRNKKLQVRAVKGIVRDGRQAKKLKKKYKDLGIPKNGDLLVPCPSKRVIRAQRGCAGEVAEKAQDLWGFAGALEKLTDYPKYARKRADQWYENSHEGRTILDTFAWESPYINGRAPKPGDYNRLTNKQKNEIAKQAQVYDGAIGRALRDAQKAGRAGAQLEF